MSFETGTATSYTDLLDKLNAFLVKGHGLSPSYTGTGNGTISGVIGSASTVQETITVTLTAATTFDVAGSVTGSMGSGTVGTPFAHAKVGFTVNAGGTAWVNGDTIVFVITPPWIQKRGVAGSEYIWEAPGNSDTESIFVGALAMTDGTTYWNWRLGGFIAFDSGAAFLSQSGIPSQSPMLSLWNSSTPYWFFANGRRAIVIAKVSTIYESAYLGFIEAYPSPSQWSYPIAVGGSMAFNAETTAKYPYSNITAQHCSFVMANRESANDYSQLRIRRPDGTWRGFTVSVYDNSSGSIWPYGNSMTDIRDNLDGTFPLFPVMFTDGNPNNVFGRLDGVMATTGYSNAVENTFTIDRQTWLVVQNTFRTSKVDYFAVRMD